MATNSQDNPVFIAGAFEHPTRHAPDKSTMQLHAEVAKGAIDDAGIASEEVDGVLTSGYPKHYALEPLIFADYLGLDVSFADSSNTGGSAHISHVGHAVSAIRDGRCDVALLTLAGRPRSENSTPQARSDSGPVQSQFESTYGLSTVASYAMAARRHMYEYGTTPEQLAEVRVAASHHAQYNKHAMYREPVTIEDVIESRTVADPLHLLDCCVISDGGGALVVVSKDINDQLERECVEVLGFGEAIKHTDAGRIDLTYSGGRQSGERAFTEAEINRADVDYASIYDSFSITVLMAIEDLGFCEKGNGGEFIKGGTLKAPNGELPFNTDGGGLCSNHPGNRGGMTKVIEAVRQLRDEANSEVQVPDCDVGIAHGTGGNLGTRHGSATLILGGQGR